MAMEKSAPWWPGIVLAVGCAATVHAQGQTSGASAVTPAALIGTWKGEHCETAPGSTISRRRQFVFTDTNWDIVVQVFGDNACSSDKLLFTANFGGDYELGSGSAAVPGAREGRYGFSHKWVTPTAAGIDFLRPRCSQYPWTPSREQDIGREGCDQLFASIPACPAEYDLTAITDGVLLLGDRSHPLCSPETRPTKLQTLGFRRQ
jgi:hypothetical protein